jgi:PIN domain nuclease of toxin-antitoxin system
VDTNALLWVLADSSDLDSVRRDLLTDPGNEVWVSAISLAEIAVKASIGKLPEPPTALAHVADRLGFRNLPFTEDHAARLGTLPLIHRDPFDRMLIAQALVEDLTIMTSDRQFAAYGVALT